MRSLFTFLASIAILGLCVFGADKKKKGLLETAPEVEIVEVKVVRDGNRLLLDGRVKVLTDKPIQGLSLTIDFLAENRKVLTSRTVTMDEEILDPGDESTFSAETRYPPNTFEYSIRAFIPGSRELIVTKAGPYPIL